MTTTMSHVPITAHIGHANHGSVHPPGHPNTMQPPPPPGPPHHAGLVAVSHSHVHVPGHGPGHPISSVASAPPRAALQRQSCYLCDLPRTPWAMLHDFSESVCRGCVNYEGPERIEVVIEAARQLKRHLGVDGASPRVSGGGAIVTVRPHPPGPPVSLSHGVHPPPIAHLTLPPHPPHTQDSPRFATGIRPSHLPPPPPGSIAHHLSPLEHAAVSMRVTAGGHALPLTLPHPKTAPTVPSLAHSNDPDHVERTRASPARSATHPSISVAVPAFPTTRIAGGGRGNEARRDSGAIPDARLLATTSALNGIESKGAARDNGHSINDGIGPEPTLVRETLITLNTCTPFSIRFKKEHSLTGRVFAVDVTVKPGAEYELKIFIEYPTGSGTVYNSASGVAKQMYQDCMKDAGKSGLSSGFKYIEYEMKSGAGDWRLLGDLLPETARIFKEPLIGDMLPTPNADASIPSPPSIPGLRYSVRRDPDYATRLALTSTRKRKELPEGLNEGAGPGAKQWAGVGVGVAPQGEALRLVTTSPGAMAASSATDATSPIAALMVAATESQPIRMTSSALPSTSTGVSDMDHAHSKDGAIGRVEGSASPREGNDASGAAAAAGTSECGAAVAAPIAPLKCTLCHERLEDTHFVQCPSVSQHKFCFPCSRESIKRQGAGTEVYCPSGEKCPLLGSNVPWAFMQGEIVTILGEESGLKIKKEKES